MIVSKSIEDTKIWIHNQKSKNLKIGFVPTMGCLHQGHLSLIDESQKNNDLTIVSIFINPLQFNDNKDFITYPNTLESDLKLIESKVDLCFTPDDKTIYPQGYLFNLSENKISKELCGLNRKNHFDGVLQVVLKLVNIVSCNRLYLGEKDFQQFALLKSLFKDMFYDIDVIACKTIRETNGLALSSRNKNLSLEQKKIASKLYKEISLFVSYLDNNSKVKTEKIIKSKLVKHGFKVNYLSIASEEYLSSPDEIDCYENMRIFCAVTLANVRLIDNVSFKESYRIVNEH